MRNKKRKYTIEDMRRWAKERNGKCLSEKYLGLTIKLSWQCANGHQWLAKPKSIRRGNWCVFPECSENRKTKNKFKNTFVEEIDFIEKERERERINSKKRKRSKEFRRNDNLMNRFGITTEIYEAMLNNQLGLCAICKSTRTINPTGQNHCVDHNHETGKIRGLLCHYCNSGIGKFNDNIEMLQKALTYLIKNDTPYLFVKKWKKKFPGNYNTLLLEQNNYCAICGRNPTVCGNKRCFVDHNPKTGYIRGILCLHCNTALGYLKDSQELLKAAIDYLLLYLQVP